MRYRIRIYALPLLTTLCLALPVTGCVSATVHQSAIDIQTDVAALERLTVPNPAYTEATQAKVEAARAELRKHVAKLVELTK